MTRKAAAEGAVDEYLNLQGRTGGNIFQFLQGNLPLQNHPGEAHIRRHFHPGAVMNPHLGGSMKLPLGIILFQQPGHPDILKNQGIGLQGFHPVKEGKEVPYLRFLYQGIQGEVEPAAQLFCMG